MKRAFAVIGFSFMLGLVLCNFFLESHSLLLAAAALIASAVCLSVRKLRKKKELCCLFICLSVSAALFSAVRYYIYSPVIGYADKKCDIEAVVLDTPTVSSGGNYSYLIRTKRINGEKKAVKMRLYVPYDISSQPYDEISFSAYPFVIGSNDKGVYLHFRSRKTYIGAYTKYDVNIHKPEKKPFMSIFSRLKAQSMKILDRLLKKDCSAFASGLLFGDTTYIDAGLKSDFRLVGLMHIMATSGLHMSVWVYGLYRLLKRIHVKEKRASIISIVFSFCVVCFSAFSASVIRAMIMTCVYLSAGLFKRRGDPLNSLGLAVFLLCAVNPFAVCDVSFLLSVFSTLGIIAAAGAVSYLKEKPKAGKLQKAFDSKPLGYISESLLMSVFASAFSYPIAVGVFGGISTVAPISNLLVVPTVAPCMVMSGMLTMLPSVRLLSNAVGFVLTLFERYIFFVVGALARLPFAYFESAEAFPCVIIPIISALALCVLFSYKRKSLSVTALSAALSVSAIVIFYYI